MPFEKRMVTATRKLWEKGNRPSLKAIDTSTTAIELRRRKRLDLYMDESRGRRQKLINERRGLDLPVTSRRPQIERHFESEMKDVARGWRLVDETYETEATKNPDDFEKQYVLRLQSDNVISNFATILHMRNAENSSLLYWDVKTNAKPILGSESDKLITLDQFSTIYLVGHGDMRRMVLAGVTGQGVAQQFLRWFKKYSVKRIVIIGCLTGSPLNNDSGQLEVPQNFTQQFHQWISPWVKAPVTGCNRCIAVEWKGGDELDEEGPEAVEYDCDAVYRTGTYDAVNKTVGVPQDRITYFWLGTSQTWKFGWLDFGVG